VAPQPIENKFKENPFIEQILLVGADKRFVSALILPSFLQLKEWMKEKGLVFTNNEEVVQHPKVQALYTEIIESINPSFNHVEQVKKFRLLPEEWGVETGEMTPKLSLKRKIIMEKYKHEIERMYA
jgi:long-chain acyl-CoA synthetase